MMCIFKVRTQEQCKVYYSLHTLRWEPEFSNIVNKDKMTKRSLRVEFMKGRQFPLTRTARLIFLFETLTTRTTSSVHEVPWFEDQEASDRCLALHRLHRFRIVTRMPQLSAMTFYTLRYLCSHNTLPRINIVMSSSLSPEMALSDQHPDTLQAVNSTLRL